MVNGTELGAFDLHVFERDECTPLARCDRESRTRAVRQTRTGRPARAQRGGIVESRYILRLCHRIVNGYDGKLCVTLLL